MTRRITESIWVLAFAAAHCGIIVWDAGRLIGKIILGRA
jgi:hypothetical protein